MLTHRNSIINHLVAELAKKDNLLEALYNSLLDQTKENVSWMNDTLILNFVTTIGDKRYICTAADDLAAALLLNLPITVIEAVQAKSFEEGENLFINSLIEELEDLEYNTLANKFEFIREWIAKKRSRGFVPCYGHDGKSVFCDAVDIRQHITLLSIQP